MDEETNPGSKPTFSTLVILTLIVCIYSWLTTILVIITGIIGGKAAGGSQNLRYILIGISLASSELVRLIGRDQLAEAAKQGGQIKLTSLQSILVAFFVIAYGCTMTWALGLFEPPARP